MLSGYGFMRLSRYTKSMIITITISIIFVISGTQTLQNVEAQQQPIPQMPQQLGPQPPQVPFSNFTASIPLATSLFDVLKSKINVSLADAMTNITNSLGPNATALSASIQSEGGFLVYGIVALDNRNNIHIEVDNKLTSLIKYTLDITLWSYIHVRNAAN
jgi:hypothetical protein